MIIIWKIKTFNKVVSVSGFGWEREEKNNLFAFCRKEANRGLSSTHVKNGALIS